MSLHSFSRYLPISDEAVRWGIHCHDAGYTQIPPDSSYPPRPEKHPRSYIASVTTGRILREFQIVYISAGKGWFEGPEESRSDIVAGDIFLLFPGVRHAYSPDTHVGWNEYWVGFSGSHVTNLYENGSISTTEPILHIGLQQKILEDFDQIIRLCREQIPGFQMLLGALIYQLLAHIHSIRLQKKISCGDNKLVDAARSIMMIHAEDGIEVEDIAAEVGVSYKHLLCIFKNYTGMTPYQYFLQLRIQQAKELLSSSTLSIKEIAFRMNFENQYYFSRLFKKKTGVSPLKWRNLPSSSQL